MKFLAAVNAGIFALLGLSAGMAQAVEVSDIIQDGDDNLASIVQAGNDLSAIIDQSGNDNEAKIIQVDAAAFNTALIDQSGNIFRWDFIRTHYYLSG